MAGRASAPSGDVDRRVRRLTCLARAHAARKAAATRRRYVAAELEVVVRRAEHGRLSTPPAAA
jgi:hypothetical protein